MIRSIRKILRSFLRNQLKDRPLTRVTNDRNDLDPLTPSQLLLLRPNSSVPSTDLASYGRLLESIHYDV